MSYTNRVSRLASFDRTLGSTLFLHSPDQDGRNLHFSVLITSQISHKPPEFSRCCFAESNWEDWNERICRNLPRGKRQSKKRSVAQPWMYEKVLIWFGWGPAGWGWWRDDGERWGGLVDEVVCWLGAVLGAGKSEGSLNGPGVQFWCILQVWPGMRAEGTHERF